MSQEKVDADTAVLLGDEEQPGLAAADDPGHSCSGLTRKLAIPVGAVILFFAGSTHGKLLQASGTALQRLWREDGDLYIGNSYEDMGTASCVGSCFVGGHGSVDIIGAGANTPEDAGTQGYASGGSITLPMGARAYMGSQCGHTYSPSDYLSLDLRGGRISYTVDLSAAECGCVAAFYLVGMPSNTYPGQCGGDYYCDACAVCGTSCAEIDVQEANTRMWKTTPHSASDPSGLVSSLYGPDYGPGSACIDTSLPFQVSAEFFSDAVDINLAQGGVFSYLPVGYPGLESMLAAGMTPVVSYWSQPLSGDMSWFDGDVCSYEDANMCGSFAVFSDFLIESL